MHKGRLSKFAEKIQFDFSGTFIKYIKENITRVQLEFCWVKYVNMVPVEPLSPSFLVPLLTLQALNSEFNLHLQTSVFFSTWQALTPTQGHPCTHCHDSSNSIHSGKKQRAYFTSSFLNLKKL